MNDNPMVNFANIIENDAKNNFNVRDDFKYLPVEQLKKISDADRLDFSVLMFNLTGDLNVGMALRTALIMGARKFYIFGRKKFDIRSTVGAQNYIDIVKIPALNENLSFDIKKFHDLMNSEGLIPVYIETNGRPIGTFSWKKDILPNNDLVKPCFVFGNETNGLPKELLHNGIIVRIPQRGVLRSLNVSAAAAIVMWDYVKEICYGGNL